MRRYWLACALILGGCAGSGGSGTAPPQMVACYDAAHQTITRTLPGACAGEVVDDRRAAEIAEERAARTRQAMLHAPPAPRPGVRSVGTGTGFFVDAGGAILTDRHVVNACRSISVQPETGPERPVQIVATDPQHDLALLRGGFVAPAVASFDPQPGGSALIDLSLVGFPEHAVQPTATPVFAPLDELAGATDHYVFHGDVHHGHSGGPILGPGGRVIGVARAMVDTARTYRATGKMITEIGLAIANPAVLGFLAENGVRYSTAAPASASPDRLAQARRFLVHVHCWH
jgi:S1-C subfamily serine protease